HVMAMSYEVTLLNDSAPMVITSQLLNREDTDPRPVLSSVLLDPRVAPAFGHRVLNQIDRRITPQGLVASYQTTNSRINMAVGIDHVVEAETPYDMERTDEPDLSEFTFSFEAVADVPIRLLKYATYQYSATEAPAELANRCRRTLGRSVNNGFSALLDEQRQQLDRFWSRADIKVEMADGSRRTQQAVRWNLFQLAQASWHSDDLGIPAKGVTGRAYEGHYFWDAEIFVLPFLAYTEPRHARNLLRFRLGMLPQARERARQLNQLGALFPWRTINGNEASANFQSSTAQYHINADIAHAIRRYVDVRGDVRFLAEGGAEMLVETARLWVDLGFYGRDAAFHIHGVAGPDEYTTLAYDYTFTNVMARMNLRYAVLALRRLRDERPSDYTALVYDLSVTESEIESWQRVADDMHLPYDDELGINPQDVTFLEREVWDLANTPFEKFPLLLHYHPLVIYRFQVLKQADVVMAMFLEGQEFTVDQKRKNFDYYDALTTGDSSLSAAVESIVASEIGNEELAFRYFRYSLLMDIADIQGNVSDGVHIASAGGVWMALVFGFGGVRDFGGRLSLDPHLPSTMASLSFALRFRDRQVRVSLQHDNEQYSLEEGDALDVTVRGTVQHLSPGACLVLPTPERPPYAQP
ncbi:MAG: kojibiose phosphorylase, partial [Acidimicrobiia bacterium]|nr:kojibiose phosphorylase [Acidimicrobiia bacterium]